MKRLILATLLFTTPIGTFAQSVDHSTDYGFVGFEGNEQTVGSKVDDPAKVRITAPITTHGGGGGVISFNLHKAMGQVVLGGGQTEMAMLRVEQASDVRGTDSPRAEFNFLCNDGGTADANMRKCLAFTYDGITAISPGIAASFRALGTGSGITDTMWAPNGLTFTQQQSDGNFVSYRVAQPFNKGASPCAMWSAWTGFIGSCQ